VRNGVRAPLAATRFTGGLRTASVAGSGICKPSLTSDHDCRSLPVVDCRPDRQSDDFAAIAAMALLSYPHGIPRTLEAAA
jgi:hypothetical protein